MAQLFSSGVTPEYLKALSDAYEMYFPKQQTYNPQTQQTTTGTFTPEAQRALQQMYSPTGYSPVNNAPTAVVPSGQQSIVGGLFEDMYPQTRGNSDGRVRDPAEQARINAFMDAEDARDVANGDPVGTTRAARIQSDLGPVANFFNPLSKVMSLVDAYKGFQDPRDTSDTSMGAAIGRGIGGLFGMGPGYESGPNGRLSAVGAANIAAMQNPAQADRGVDTSGRSDTANGPEGRGAPGDRGDWGRGGGY